MQPTQTDVKQHSYKPHQTFSPLPHFRSVPFSLLQSSLYYCFSFCCLKFDYTYYKLLAHHYHHFIAKNLLGKVPIFSLTDFRMGQLIIYMDTLPASKFIHAHPHTRIHWKSGKKETPKSKPQRINKCVLLLYCI